MDFELSTTDELEMVARLLLAVGLGAFIGVERELRGYPAGIRTLGLVAVGSALFTEMSQLFEGDEGRVAAQIVTGIGFLGAGVIFREQHTVRGITTAATIWAAAAVGMAVGLELYIVAIATAVAVFVVLESRPLTRRFERAIRPAEEKLRDGLRADDPYTDEDEPIRDDD